MCIKATLVKQTLTTESDNLDLVAAERVVAVGGAVAPVGPAPEVPRAPVVVEDDFLVELSQIVHGIRVLRGALPAAGLA